MSKNQIIDEESQEKINEKYSECDINYKESILQGKEHYKKNNSENKMNIHRVFNQKTILEEPKGHFLKNKEFNYSEKNKIDMIVEDKIIKKEKDNILSEIDKVDDFTLISNEVLIKNSYEVTFNLFHIISHVIEAENKLKRQNKLLNKALQDILHKIESDKFNVVEGYKLAKKIQLIRNQKTLIRDNLLIYQQLNELGIFNEDIINNLNIIITELEKNKDFTYEPKVLKNLEFRYDNEKIYDKYADIKKEDFKSIGIEDF